MTRPKPRAPHPELIRQPAGRFGWLDDALLHDGWLAELGPHGSAVLLLLALAADRHGASFFGRVRIARTLAMSRNNVDQAFARLLQVKLVAHRPWQNGDPDGVWQLLPLPTNDKLPPPQRAANALPLREALANLGFAS